MTQVTFRPFTPADVELAPALFIEALQTIYPNIEGGEWTSDLENIPQSYQEDGGDFLMGEVDGEVVAEGGIHRVDDKTAEMKRVAVSPDAQEGGIGQMLVRTLEDRARELGFNKMVLDTTLGQAAARHIYEKAGYELVYRRVVDHPSGTTFDTFFYEKDLTNPTSNNEAVVEQSSDVVTQADFVANWGKAAKQTWTNLRKLAARYPDFPLQLLSDEDLTTLTGDLDSAVDWLNDGRYSPNFTPSFVAVLERIQAMRKSAEEEAK